MADPLGITASVAGLLAAAGKISSMMHTVVSGLVADMPESATLVLSTVDETRLELQAITHLLNTITSVSSWRRALVQLDHIALVLASCVLTLSELEALVTLRQRLYWMWNDRPVLRILSRLESEKMSLSLMVMILQCQSHFDVVRERIKLVSAVVQVRNQNEELSRRLQNMKRYYKVDAPTVKFLGDADSATTDSKSTFPPSDKTRNSEETSQSSTHPSPRDFKVVLESSWVYSTMRTRNQLGQDNAVGWAVRSNAWTMLTGKSLNHISELSVFRLPITVYDIAAFGADLTFGTILSNWSLKPVPPPVVQAHAQPLPKFVSSSELRDMATYPALPNTRIPRHLQARETRTPAPAMKGEQPAPIFHEHNMSQVELAMIGDTSFLQLRLPLTHIVGPLEDEPTNPSLQKPYRATAHKLTPGKSREEELRQALFPVPHVLVIFAEMEPDTNYKDVWAAWFPELFDWYADTGVPRILFVAVRDSKKYPLWENWHNSDAQDALYTAPISLTGDPFQVGLKCMNWDWYGGDGKLQAVYDAAIALAVARRKGPARDSMSVVQKMEERIGED